MVTLHRSIAGLHILIVLVNVVFPVRYGHLVQHFKRYANILETGEELILKVPLIGRRY